MPQPFSSQLNKKGTSIEKITVQTGEKLTHMRIFQNEIAESLNYRKYFKPQNLCTQRKSNLKQN